MLVALATSMHAEATLACGLSPIIYETVKFYSWKKNKKLELQNQMYRFNFQQCILTANIHVINFLQVSCPYSQYTQRFAVQLSKSFAISVLNQNKQHYVLRIPCIKALNSNIVTPP